MPEVKLANFINIAVLLLGFRSIRGFGCVHALDASEENHVLHHSHTGDRGGNADSRDPGIICRIKHVGVKIGT